MFRFELLQLLFIFIGLLVVSWYLYYLYCFTYWKKKGVPTLPPQFPAGNILKSMLGQENIFTTIENCYKEFKSQGHRHGGLYFLNGPVYVPIDPEIIKSILTTDFEYFVDRGMFVDEENHILTRNLFNMKGVKWRNLRNKLSPVFTSGKLKSMYAIFLKMAENFIDTVEGASREKGEVNIKHISANFTADIIFSTAFGLESDSLKYPNNKYAKIIRALFNPPARYFWKTLLQDGLQNPGNLIKIVMASRVQEEFFRNLVNATIKYRDENKIERKDLLALMLEIRDTEGLSFETIVAQSFLFFLAGFETSSQTISYCIHELSHNQIIQDKLRKEIYENLGTDFRKYSYDDIIKLPYLDKVFNETLRLYPVLGFFNRICAKPYKVPGTNITIEEGTPVMLPISGLQRDPEYFPEPLKFDPERFSEGQQQVPFSFLPFGDGPRFCIGMRYGKLQTKLGIAAMVSQFKFHPHPDMPRFLELDKMSKALVMFPVSGLKVKVEKI